MSESDSSPSRLRSPRARWLSAGVVLAIMALMAVVSLVVSLKTMTQRRTHDQNLLGYLPGDVNLITALHVAKLMEEKTGREFLSKFRLGRDGPDFTRFEEWTGLGRDDIADVVAGWKVDAGSPCRLTLLVQTRQPYVQTKLWESLRNERPIARNQKDLYQLDRQPVPLTVWGAGPRTLVFGLSQEDLDAIPLTPRTGVAHLPMPLQRFPGDAQASKAQVWVIGDADHWDQTAVWPLAASIFGEARDLAREVSTLGLWLRFDRSVSLGAAAHATSEPAARSLEESLLQKGVADRGRLERANDGWLTFHAQAGVGTLCRWGGGKW